MELKNKKILVYGFGLTGKAVLNRLLDENSICVFDDKPIKAFKPEDIDLLKKKNVEFYFNVFPEEKIKETDILVLSPGIAKSNPLIKKFSKGKIPIISEIELAYHFLKKPIIAVTGTNGKTTTTTLIGEIIKVGGKRVEVAGNIGNPLISIVDSDLDFIVAEVSSYQLEWIKDFRPWISIILNLDDDHIKWHTSREEYFNAKGKIFQNQNGEDFLIYNDNDINVKKIVDPAKAKKMPFQNFSELGFDFNIQELKLKGNHNLQNIQAAVLAASIAGIDKEKILEAVASFSPLEHRIEYVTTINDVKFYNDSKGTNPHSTINAIGALRNEGRIVLILGGKDKGLDVSHLCRVVKEDVCRVVLLGESSSRFSKELENQGYADFVFSTDLEDAVQKAFSISKKKDIVLLSPACSSFDMFSSYEERGDKFKVLTNRLANEKK
jgi:UDP-N-acetylmuramoylalanine--D-glutamate ligase